MATASITKLFMDISPVLSNLRKLAKLTPALLARARWVKFISSLFCLTLSAIFFIIIVGLESSMIKSGAIILAFISSLSILKTIYCLLCANININIKKPKLLQQIKYIKQILIHWLMSGVLFQDHFNRIEESLYQTDIFGYNLSASFHLSRDGQFLAVIGGKTFWKTDLDDIHTF